MNILLSIKPKCARLIYEGKKTIEWREHRREVKRAWYARKQEDKLNGNTNPTP